MRYLPTLYLLLTFIACGNDPLNLTTVEVDATSSQKVLPTVEITTPTGWNSVAGIYYNEAPGSLELLPTHADISLSLDLKLAKGTEATLWIQDRYPLRIPSFTVDAVNGGESTPRIHASVSPDIWQQLEIVFKAATVTTPPLLVSAYLNGNLLYYQQPLAAVKKTTGPLRIEVRKGKLELSAPAASDQAGQGSQILTDGAIELKLPLIHYRYYDLPEGTDDVTRWADLEPAKSGFIDRFDLNAIREKNIDYAIRFDGQLDVPQTGEYRFKHWGPASGRVYIDGVLVADNGGKHPAQENESSIQLSAGAHEFRWDHVQNSGWNAGSIDYVAPGGDSGKLNGMNGKLAAPGSGSPTPVVMDDKPYLLRSFLYFPAPKVYAASAKRTHVISVGEKEGPHYSIDLQTGSLLQVWRGEFANVHDMWDGRGEPQIMKPLGNAIAFDGTPQWFSLDQENSVWPDSLPSSSGFRHLRHELDALGRPTFYYRYGTRQVADRLEPKGEVLQRTLTNTSSVSLFTQLISAEYISETAPGEFSLRGPGLDLSIISNEGSRLVLQRGKGIDRLLAEVPPNGEVVYDLNW